MASSAIKISILADAGPAVAAFKDVGAQTDTMNTKLKDADQHVSKFGDNADKTASKSSILAGAMGDLGGGLAAIGLSGAGPALTNLGIALQFAAGLADIAAISSELLTVANIKNAASTVASKAAMVAGAIATGAATAAQWALNVAMTANPIGLIIAGIVLLIGVIVLIATKTTWFQDIWKVAWSGIKAAADAVWTFLKAVGAWFAGPFVGFFVGGFNAVKSAIVGVVTDAKAKVDAIIGFFTGIPGTLRRVGGDIVDGLLSGLSAAWHLVTDKIKSLVNAIPAAIRKFLGISSPSKVMTTIGGQITTGLALGITGQLPALRSALSTVSGAITGGITASPAVELTGTGTARNTATAGTVNVTVTVPPASDPAEVGRQIVKAIRSYQDMFGRTVLVA